MNVFSQRFVLLDRDGTIIVERNYLSDYHLVELLPGAAEGLRRMREMGLGLVVVTNQSSIGRRYFSLKELDLIHKRMIELLSVEGASVDGIFYCPHTPEEECGCRKPRIGLVEKAVASFGFHPSQSFVIGDKPCDIEMGRRINAKTFLVRTGYGVKVEAERSTNPDCVVNDLIEAASIIHDELSQ